MKLVLFRGYNALENVHVIAVILLDRSLLAAKTDTNGTAQRVIGDDVTLTVGGLQKRADRRCTTDFFLICVRLIAQAAHQSAAAAGYLGRIE